MSEPWETGHQGARAALSVGSGPVRSETTDSGRIRAVGVEDRFGRMVGRSTAMQVVFDVLGKAAASDATILLEGETGTGKEVSAEAIHRGSPRRDKPFLVVDCGAMPPQLLESELFGHERGAFTGAVSARQGVFEAADGGTVFLDEIGELSHRSAAEAAARARAARGPAGRHQQPRTGQRAAHRRHQPQPARAGGAPRSSAPTSTTGWRSSR